MSRIQSLKARQVFDSRGYPTVEVEMRLRSGVMGRAIVPSGASTGRFEALELRDGDVASFSGKGVSQAVANVNDRIAPEIMGCDALNQAGLDQRLVDIEHQLRRLSALRETVTELREAAIPIHPESCGPDQVCRYV